jgi:purine nucleosidase
MTPIWLDADPGFDDWMTMLMLAHAHREQKIAWLGTSVVHGNAPLSTTWENAQAIASQYQLPCPIFKGSNEALAGGTITAQSVLGVDGMRTDGAILRAGALTTVASHNGVEKLIEAIDQNPHQLTLIATGPLTNIAHSVVRQPSITKRLKKLILMGGSTDRGNHTPAAEFNVFADCEAADIVFCSGINIAMFGLNICRQVLLTQDDVMRFTKLTNDRAKCFAGYLDGYQRIRSRDGSVPMPIYDPVVAAYLINPLLFELSNVRVDIELKGEFTRGMTVCDFKAPANAQVAMQCNSDDVHKLILGYTLDHLNSL